MLFCAEWLLLILFFLVVVWSSLTFGVGSRSWLFLYGILGTAWVSGLAMSYLIALMWPHPRPIVEHPKTRQLFRPFEVWKSFPSDHTLSAFILAIIPYQVGVSSLWGTIFFLLAAAVSFSRVYAGVHYPRDIAGGIVLAFIVSSLVIDVFLYTTPALFSAPLFMQHEIIQTSAILRSKS